MPRIRSIKPEFFRNEGLSELGFAHRVLFVGLWTQADREGRMRDRPGRLKGELLPYDEVDVDAMLQKLHDHPESYIIRYEKDKVKYIQVRNFALHQQPHIKEPQSLIPPPDGYDACTRLTPDQPVGREGKGREGNGKGGGTHQSEFPSVRGHAALGTSLPPARRR